MNFVSTAGSAVVPILIVFLAAAVLALVLTPIVRRIVIRYEIVDQPEERRVNVVPVPRAGGLAVSAAFLLVAGIFLIVNEEVDLIAVPVKMQPSAVAVLLFGGAIAAALGAIDDLFDLRTRWQLLGQVLLGVAAVAARVTIDFIANPFGPGVVRFDAAVAAGLTIFWVVGMINSINWIDGLDGLSTGVAFIAAVTLGLISLTTQVGGGQPLIGVLCFALAGALLGFLRWNFNPASIFQGKSGVQFVGSTLAVLDHRPADLGGSLTVQPGPDAHPPPPARPRAEPPADRPRDLRDLSRPGRAVVAAVGRDPAVRLPGHLRGLRPDPLPADAR